MIFRTQSAFLSQCPLCGAVEFERISLFAMSGGREIKVTCGCDFIKLIISTRDFHKFSVQAPCFLCEEDHVFYFTQRQLWEKDLIYLECPDSDIKLGFIGAEDQVHAAMADYEDQLGSLVEEIGFDDYFDNPQVAYRVLNHLHEMAGENRIFCQCGNTAIEVGMFPTKIDLHCPDCGSIMAILTQNEQDYQHLMEKDLIEMIEGGYDVINSGNLKTPRT